MTGSSPHTRGAPSVCCPAFGFRRIIPAYAGSTFGDPGGSSALPDHPRIRGEHYAKTFEDWNVQGSSPHTRGAQGVESRRRVLGRIIPAYAGSTSPSFQPSRWLWDHPRIRGEHRVSRPATGRVPGSSPHTRGARRSPTRTGASARIIPAYAGSTGGFMRWLSRARDHPRIRGEHST